MESIKRPARNETDEDLLKEQELFLQEKKNLSVHLVSKNKKSKQEDSLSDHADTSHVEELCHETTEKPMDVQISDFVFDVQERNVSFSKPFVFQPAPVNSEKIHQLSNKTVKVSKFASRKKDQSIFLQMLNLSEDKKDSNCGLKVSENSVLIDGSGLVPNSQEEEAKKIHEENLAKISAMSKEEILHHQEELKNYLKPDILSFIQKRKNMKDENLKSDCQVQRTVLKSSVNNNLKNEQEVPGVILRKEGNTEYDALILEKVLNSEDRECVPENQTDGDHSENGNKEKFYLPEEAKELIDGNNKGLWRNMNKIEKEKLKWMTNLPQPKPVDLKTGYAARFDFEGKLLSREADIPTYKGLHHHGEEPEIPGYSLEELFLLARSSLQSQRITALNTIAHILENNWCGMVDACFDAPLLPMLLNAGIVPLLRWALDDTSLTSVAATVTAIHSLLISKPDEACLHKTFCWLNGHFVPHLEPQGLDEPNIVIEELTDADLIKLDVIKGFLRIDILPRFMYILKVMCPPPLVCKLIIEICARLAQHSTESAKQVAEHPGLLKLIFEKFLPDNWQFVDSSILTDTVNYQCPMHSALKLIRIIASSSKELAVSLIENYSTVSKLSLYLTIQPIDGKLPAQDVQFLVIEALKMWHTFLCYGLTVNIFLNLFPILLKQLDFCVSLDLNCDVDKHIKDFDYATHLFKCFEAVAVIAAENQEDTNASFAVNVFFNKALVCLKKWIWQFSQEKTLTVQMTLLAACMNFIVIYCRKSHEEQLTCKDWEPCSAAKEVFEKYLVPSMKSNIFQNLLKDFRSSSLFLCSEINGNKRDGKTIVSLGSVLYGEDIVPILKEGSPLPLFSAVLNYILLYKNFFHDIGNECLEILLCPAVFDYLKAVSTEELKNSCWFLKFETFYIYQLIQLSSYIVSPESLVCHEIAVSILPAFTASEESLVKDLFENIIMSQDIILKVASVVKFTSLNEKNELHSLALRLPVIAQCYTSCFLNTEAVLKSRNLLLRNTELDSLFCLSTPHALINKDWCFSPIFQLYQKMKQRKGGENVTPEETLQITSSLQWIYLCHILNLPVLKKIPASAEFYYLFLVFLLDEDLFRDEKIKTLLVNCASVILEQKKLNLSKINWNNLKNIDDLYLELLIQYEAVSYGDEVFGSFLVLPLQQTCRSQWKKLFLIEHSSILRFLRVPLKKLLVPLQNFLEPIETDMRVLTEYFKVLASGTLNHRCPLLYLMAVHHIHNFIFMRSDTHLKEQNSLLSNILRTRKDLKDTMLLYLKVDETAEYGFCLSENLSPENAAHLSSIMGEPVNI